jgi:ABC-type multidrug transport system fused ATPase/permease subunit
MASARELRRIESGTRAPLLSHISESIDGLSTIQAYGAAPRFVQAADAKQDRNLRATRVSSLLNCWLGLRLELLGSVIASVATLLAFRKNGRLFVAGASATAGTAALSVSLSMQVVQTLNWSVRQACDLEAHLVAVERLGSYRGLPPEPGLDLPPEPGLDLPGDGAADGIAGAGQARALEQGAGGRRGKLELSGVGLRYSDGLPLTEITLHTVSRRLVLMTGGAFHRYRDGLPPVLSEVSATVQPGERVGVVGRTGSGKSSLFAALTRLVAPPLRSGRIFIDGRDISALPLRAYRSSLTVIPQEPVLFEGTVRFNLDPLRRHEDEELWAALRQVQLAAVVRSLDEQVAEDGANFSAGQQQLLVIGRALLSRPALLLMDEATSSVDAETDALIQRTVRACFGQATVLTIAHRLETVLDADKILVLDEGRCVEFGPPALLLERRGAFHRMVEERGPGGGRA